MSAEAIVALVGVAMTLQLAVAGFMWRNLSNQSLAIKADLERQIGALGQRIDAVKTDLEGQIGSLRSDLEGQIGSLRSDLEGQIGALGQRIDAVKTDLEGQIGSLRSDLEGQIGSLRSDLEGQIGSLRSDLEGQIGSLGQRIVDLEARTEKAHARIESNIKGAENRLLDRIDKQSERIDALHRDLRGLGERVATVEARA